MTEDNKQDRSQTEGQEGIDRETELRNRENETGQPQDQQFGQSSGQASPRQNQGNSAFGKQQDQSSNSETTLSERTGATGGQSSSGQTGGQNSDSFVGSGNDNSSDYLTKGEQGQEFAPEGQGAQDSDAGRSDIETGQSIDREAGIEDDGSDSDR